MVFSSLQFPPFPPPQTPQLLAAFGGMRDQMMQEDLAAWIDMNDIYPGVAESVRRLVADHEAYIVTTKQARFAEAILHRLAGVDLPPERIFSQAETGAPKSEILHLLEERHPGTQYHFVEDKALTLHKARNGRGEGRGGVDERPGGGRMR